MTVPLPFLVAFAVLLGWPLVQLISVLWVRSDRARAKALAAELLSDSRFDEDERETIRGVLKDAKGSPIFLLFPFAFPALIVFMSIAQLVARPTHKGGFAAHLSKDMEDERADMWRELRVQYGSRLVDDPRFRELFELTGDIGFARWPLTAFFATGLSALVFPLYVLAYGVSRSLAGLMANLRHAIGHRLAYR